MMLKAYSSILPKESNSIQISYYSNGVIMNYTIETRMMLLKNYISISYDVQ